MLVFATPSSVNGAIEKAEAFFLITFWSMKRAYKKAFLVFGIMSFIKSSYHLEKRQFQLAMKMNGFIAVASECFISLKLL